MRQIFDGVEGRIQLDELKKNSGCGQITLRRWHEPGLKQDLKPGTETRSHFGNVNAAPDVACIEFH
jgi:hypothetical protein